MLSTLIVFQEERSDASGERVGSYSYVDPEGNQVTVRYERQINTLSIIPFYLV